jgi:hypothetical protein
VRGDTRSAADAFEADPLPLEWRGLLDPVRRPEAARGLRESHVASRTGELSEGEILIAYGGVAFSSKLGQLAGNHFATIVSAGGESDYDSIREALREMGRRVLWEGAQGISIEELS